MLICRDGLGLVRQSQADEDRDEVGRVGEDFGERGIAVVTEEGFEEQAEGGVFVDERVHIPDVLDDGGNPADLIELVDAVRDETCREEDQQEACHLEEAAQVEADDGREDRPAEQDGRAEAEDRADEGLERVGGEDGGGEEEGEFDALAQDGEESDEEDGTLARGEGGFVDVRFEVRFERAGGAAHPEDHPGEQRGGGDHGDAFEDLFSGAFEGKSKGGEQDGGQQAERGGRESPQPDGGDQIRAAHLTQRAEHDADDQGGFDAFTEGEQVTWEHGHLGGEKDWDMKISLFQADLS